MTIDQAQSTNGRVSVEHVIEDTRNDLRRRSRLRPGKLAVPVFFALGVILLLRHFESSTSR